MPGLWADGWFYISSAGLLLSGALFFFLLGQYRAAAEAADEAHVDESIGAPATMPVRPVYVSDDELRTAPLAAASAPAPSTASKPSMDPLSTGATSTGGVSPAVVYLQNLKTDLEEMGVELRSLGKKVAAVSERDEALIDRLSELTRAVEELKGVVVEPPTPKRRKTDKAAAVPEPAPEPQPVAEPAPVAVAPEPEPAPVPSVVVESVALVAPAPEPEPAPVVAAPEPAAPAALTIELGSAPGTGAPVETPAAASNPDATMSVEDLKSALEQQGEKAEEEKPRRGPVWPV